MIDIQLERLTLRMNAAANAMETHLLKLFPKGTRIEFNIMHGQVKPSTGVVRGVAGSIHGGYLTVAHDQAKPYSRYGIRSVHISNVVRVLK